MIHSEVPSHLLYYEVIWMTGLTLGGMAYGSLLTIGIECLFAFHSSANGITKGERKHSYLQRALQAHVFLILIINTFLQAWNIQSHVKEIVFTDPSQFTHFDRDWPNIFVLLLGALTDGLLVWRSYMIQKALFIKRPAGAHNLCWILPMIAYISMISIGVASVILVNPHDPIGTTYAVDDMGLALFFAALVLNVFINLFTSCNIIIRLLLHRRTIITAFGKSCTLAEYSLRISGILLESAAIDIPLTFVAIVGVSLHLEYVSLVMSILVPGQCISSVLVTYQVVRGRSISSSIQEELDSPRVLQVGNLGLCIGILLKKSEPDALFDSAASNTAPRCHPGTREQYIEDFVHWAIPSPLASASLPLRWMKGLAGVGKSAIARSCVDMLNAQSIPFAAFFFLANVRDKPERFFPTIAYQLSLHFPDYRDLLNAKILHDKTIINKTLRGQFQRLILEPLQELSQNGKGIRKQFPIFVDGLDECRSQQAQCDIVHIVADAARTDSPPLLWAFFSRPEPHIEGTFCHARFISLTHAITLPISRSVDGEIELYLRAGFEAILRQRNMQGYQWPSDRDIKRLVDACNGVFNYGVTALRFIGSPFWPVPEEPLRQVLDGSRALSRTISPSDLPSPFAELDTLYLKIMQRIPPGILPLVMRFLTFLCVVKAGGYEGNGVVYFNQPLEPNTSRWLRDYGQPWEFGASFLLFVIRGLGGSIRFYHKSFFDFLVSIERSGPFCVATPTAQSSISEHLVDLHLFYDTNYALSDHEPVAASSHHLSIMLFIVFSAGVMHFDSIKIDLLKKYAGVDFRKALKVTTSLSSSNVSLPGQMMYSNYEGSVRIVQGTELGLLNCQEFAQFNAHGFQQTIERHKAAGILHPVTHYAMAAPHDQFLSGLFIQGSVSKSIFWYWEIDFAAQTYKEVQAIDLDHGMKLFRDENFEEWH
ncbi:hypothetical protein D9756_007798 [Leucocoprinus leucothites]|uniref:Nephrocystin 3-like N-terminal domain-containing protein n=1 Tax=Leucocoprinus leucothites TaxID=201217 RepID=A0A8H5D3Z8_9AGAR|nr:hypothetical protein D9756_007798 [Leucoagaricus leucothites]